jgi:toxin-antitoxin system PIN domain toxin
MTPDVNVLVAAFRADHTHHLAARRWLLKIRQDCVRGTATLMLLPVVITGFLRLVTNTRVFKQTDAVEDAVAFLDAILAAPGVALANGVDEWPVLRNLLLAKKLHGNLNTDAWIAAATQVRGEHLVTFDRDFRRLLPARDVTVLAQV